MKLTCDMIQDLLPLYEDGVCSQDSREAVEAHLRTCAACRGSREAALKLPEQDIMADAPEEMKVVCSLKKVRRRWAISLIAVLLAVPVLLLSFNQVRGAGVCFTNIDEILLAKRFVRYIRTGNYEKAAQMYDFRDTYQDILEILSTTPEACEPDFTECKIGDEVWYIRSDLAEDIDFGGDEVIVWSPLIYNRYQGVLIPQEQMDAAIALEPEAVTYENDGYTVTGQTFLPLDTPWGRFLAEASDIDAFLQSNMEPTDYGVSFTVMPEEMYLDIYPALLENNQQLLEANVESYSAVGHMTEADFCTYMQETYASELEAAFSDGLTMSGSRYTLSYRRTASSSSFAGEPTIDWNIGIQSQITYQEETFPITIDVTVCDGMVTVGSLSFPVELSWGNQLCEALFPSYLQ